MSLVASRLELKLRKRPGEKLSNGAYTSERNYVDFVVDGRSISDGAISAGYDLVSVFAREWQSEERSKSLRRLLLRDSGDFPNDRRSLLVCAECGDLGCGAVSIIVDYCRDVVTWSAFGYQNNYEDQIYFEQLRDMGPFTFNLQEYERTLNRTTALLHDSNES